MGGTVRTMGRGAGATGPGPAVPRSRRGPGIARLSHGTAGGTTRAAPEPTPAPDGTSLPRDNPGPPGPV